MAITIASCCSKPALPPSASTSSKTPAHQIPRMENEKWRRQSMIGMACVIIGLEINDLSIESNISMAMQNSTVVESKNTQRWSDKRICPSWNLNSLETIVPENLPRPSARRRWESVGHTKNIPAPAWKVEVKVKTINDCFTM